MKNILALISFSTFLLITSCRKSTDTPNNNFDQLKDAALTDFVNKVAIPGYEELQTRITSLNEAIVTLNGNATEGNLQAARQAWRDARATWERCEGFLFGPVEDNEYDPETDTWPVSFNDLDSLMNSNNPLGVADIEALTQRSLKGYHPIEYILWGKDGNRTAVAITDREKQYVTSLSLHLKSQAEQLNASWSPIGGNYGQHILNAGKGSSLYPKKHDAYITILEGLLGICEEVAEGKMKEPFDAQDPNIVESPFSGNSVADFKNNITGAFNVYLGKFNEDGTGLNELVRARNISLDNELKEKFNTAINSFNGISLPYEKAIIQQRVQCQKTMDAISELAETLDSRLRSFINQNVTD